ncbi:PAS domain S-box protein [Flavobacterium sp.]|uniref:PAS domain-containing sensor histidine kinase n=1 Tax=Flavobacterium sp. TaxID=239 RepID=UPI00286AEEE9|nr:PAS domain S-box protein [Flavobacterium sp.]
MKYLGKRYQNTMVVLQKPQIISQKKATFIHWSSTRFVNKFYNKKMDKNKNAAKFNIAFESEKLYRNLFTNMLHGFAYCKVIYNEGELIDFTYLAVNSQYEALTGLKDIVDKKMSEVMPDLLESDPDYVALMNRVSQGGKSEKFETYVAPLDKWFSVSIYSPANGYFVTLVDNITEQKNATRELEIREERFRALIENNEGIISLTDDALNSIYRSPSSARITGWTADDMKAKSGINYIHPDDKIIVENTVAKAIKNYGIPQPYTARYMHKNGHYIWLEGTATKLPDESVLKGIIFNSRDVSERFELENLLRKSNALSRIGSWDVDLVKQTVYWSDITKEIHEAESSFVPDLATGLNFYKEGTGRELITQKVKEAIEFGEPWDEELEIVTAKNNIRWIRTIGQTEFVEGKCVKIYGSFQDITERKKNEAAIQKSEEKFSALVKASSDMVYRMSPDWSVMYQLDGRGFIPDTLKPNSHWFQEYIHPNDQAQVMSVIKEAIRTKSIFELEHPVLKVDGTLGWTFSRALPLFDAKGDIVEWFGAASDITERKKAESKLIENENYLRTILDTEPECVKVLNSKGELLSMNPAGLVMIEADNEQQVLGCRMTDLVDQKYRIGFNRLTKAVFKGNSGTFEFEVTGLKGGRRWLETHAVPLKDATGKIINLLGVTRDITQKKNTEIEIRLSEEKYRNLFEKNPMPMWIFDANGLQFLEVNTAAIEHYGFTRAEFLGMTLDDVRPTDKNIELSDLTNNNYRNSFDIYSIHKKKNGSLIKVQVSVSSIFFENKLARLALLIDKTEQEKAKDDLIAKSEELSQLASHLQNIREDERKRIAREIHDDLGQQLTAIKMDTVWIDKQIPAKTVAVKKKLKNMLELLDGSHQSVRKILNELRPRMLDDYVLLEALQWQGEQFTASTGTPVHFTTNQSTIALPQETATCIFRIYQEALTNITRYASASHVISSLNIINDYIILTIEDDGNGFDPKMVESKKSFGLLGMKERVFSFKGKFDLVSSPGKGTKIVISLPNIDLFVKDLQQTKK